ncbi:Rab2a [Hexamita inflata]|uniref:Rab2a n=1 Tax=Hexamita inflata TaxID=28002 RepID=A0ABP1H9E0_9EUKA
MLQTADSYLNFQHNNIKETLFIEQIYSYTYHFTTKYKVIVVGSLGAGKSLIIDKLVNSNEQFRNEILNVSYKSHVVDNVELEYWDLDGQEHVQILSRFNYKHAKACMIVADINAPNLFENVHHWFKCVTEYTQNRQDIPIILILNKIDLCTEAEVSLVKIRKFCKLDRIIKVSAEQEIGLPAIEKELMELIIHFEEQKQQILIRLPSINICKQYDSQFKRKKWSWF